MFAIGHDELGPPLNDTIKCPHCGADHAIENSGPSKTISSDGTVGVGPAGMLQFYRCGENLYLAGIQGRSI